MIKIETGSVSNLKILFILSNTANLLILSEKHPTCSSCQKNKRLFGRLIRARGGGNEEFSPDCF